MANTYGLQSNIGGPGGYTVEVEPYSIISGILSSTPKKYNVFDNYDEGGGRKLVVKSFNNQGIITLDQNQGLPFVQITDLTYQSRSVTRFITTSQFNTLLTYATAKTDTDTITIITF